VAAIYTMFPECCGKRNARAMPLFSPWGCMLRGLREASVAIHLPGTAWQGLSLTPLAGAGQFATARVTF
jgi:hypothetical protein